MTWPDEWDHCYEDMGDGPCGKEPAGARRDWNNGPGDLYPVCRKHLRP
jgi:hypothetical protein